jgi:hypothetical protein
MYGCVGIVLALGTVWACAALHFDMRVAWLKIPLLVLYVAALGRVWFVRGPFWLKTALTTLLFACVLGWWLSLKPSNHREWQPDVATLAWAEFDGDKITVRNVRNCLYRTETDYEPRYYDKTYDVSKLRSVDMYMVYWGSPSIAHTMASFGFDSGDYLCFSIETREEKGEGYSPIKGLFRQFEVVYVAADEKDLVRLRANYRQGEDVFLYRLSASPEQARQFFLTYIRRLNELRANPKWYNVLTMNCTIGIRTQRAATQRAPWDWRMLANGHLDELLYARGAISTNLPMPEMKLKCLINARAREAGDADDFSARIREGVPGIQK